MVDHRWQYKHTRGKATNTTTTARVTEKEEGRVPPAQIRKRKKHNFKENSGGEKRRKMEKMEKRRIERGR